MGQRGDVDGGHTANIDHHRQGFHAGGQVAFAIGGLVEVVFFRSVADDLHQNGPGIAAQVDFVKPSLIDCAGFEQARHTSGCQGVNLNDQIVSLDHISHGQKALHDVVGIGAGNRAFWAGPGQGRSGNSCPPTQGHSAHAYAGGAATQCGHGCNAKGHGVDAHRGRLPRGPQHIAPGCGGNAGGVVVYQGITAVGLPGIKNIGGLGRITALGICELGLGGWSRGGLG